jgi:hypothetical protein
LAQDPVVASDGQSYERTAIEDYVRRRTEQDEEALSPFTREPLQPHFFPNIALRKRIESHAADELRVAEAAAEAARAAGEAAAAAARAAGEAAAAAARAEGEVAGRAEGVAAERKRQAEAASSSDAGDGTEGSVPKRARRR